MTEINLSGGYYKAKGYIAGAQRSVNLYAEKNEPDAPFPWTYYARAGLKLKVIGPGAPSRACYRANNGQLFEVIGGNVYYTDPALVRHLLGNMASAVGIVSMADNYATGGDTLVIVDGTAAGYVVKLSTHAMSTIVDAAFYGSTRVEYQDTYFIFNRPDTNQFYLSPNNWNGTDPFDALEIANKVGGADNICVVAANAGNLQVIGTLTTEIWYNAQGADFVFARVPSVFIEHGSPAPYSVAQTDTGTYFLSQDDDGGCIFMKIVGYAAQRFSTHAIEVAISKYADVTDCVATTYQQEGHAFVRFSFPSADASWVWDEGSQVWHEETWTDPSDGSEHRHRAALATYCYGMILSNDWQDGTLYQESYETFTDEGPNASVIVKRRGFPHIIKDAKRVSYTKFVANMQTGTADGLTTDEPPLISLRWSDTRGASWNDPVTTDSGSTGDYARWITFWQLGLSQDRVFELFWDSPYFTALGGAFVDVVKSLS